MTIPPRFGRGEHEPAREAELEVRGDREAREDAAERRGLDADEPELKRRVAARVLEVRRVLDAGEAARERDEEEQREQDARQEERRVRERVVDPAPGDGERDRAGACEGAHVRSSLVRRARALSARNTTMTARRDREGRPQRARVPARDHEAADALDHVRDRVVRRDRAKPVLLDEVAREERRAEEQQDEEQREEPLDGLPGAGAQRDERAEARERHADRDREDDEHERAADARRDPGAERQADEQVDERADDAGEQRAAELADEQRGAGHRRQREPVEEAVLDVAREVLPAVERREQRALHERDGEREVEVARGREAGQLRSPRRGRRC